MASLPSNPSPSPENTYFPPVAITDFPAFQQKRRYRHQRFPLSQSVTYTREINLKYNRNSFAFRFAALCYAAPEENYLSYTLKGFDKEWYSTTKSSTASYTNLKPGDYTFCVKTATPRENGVMTSKVSTYISHLLSGNPRGPIFFILYFRQLVSDISSIASENKSRTNNDDNWKS